MLHLQYDPTRKQIDESEKIKKDQYKNYLIGQREQKITLCDKITERCC